MARALGLAQPTIGRHVDALEAQLGQPLFIRSPSGLLPTPAAQALRPLAEAMDTTAAALERAARSQAVSRDGGVSGVVRVTASEVIGVEVLPPLLAQLRASHPGLVVELVLSNRVQDLLRREADIAVRMTPPRQEQLIARKVGTVELALFAHESYLARRGTPISLESLAQDGHTLIGFDQPSPYLRELAQSFPLVDRERFHLRADSDLAQLALIRAGAGIGVCQVALARREPSLRPVLPDALRIPHDTWVTMHEDLRDSAGCKVVFEALVAGLQRHVAEAD